MDKEQTQRMIDEAGLTGLAVPVEPLPGGFANVGGYDLQKRAMLNVIYGLCPNCGAKVVAYLGRARCANNCERLTCT